MNKRLTNKRLVRFLMDYKGLELITVSKTYVLVEVSKRFTPSDGEELCRLVGHPDARPATSEGRNFISFKRF